MRSNYPSSRACNLGPWFMLMLFFVSQSRASPCSASGTSATMSWLETHPPGLGLPWRRKRTTARESAS